jgi:hypothetical protein
MGARGSFRLLAVFIGCWLVAACSSQGDGPSVGDAAVWTTRDASTWNRVIDPDLGGPGSQQMTGIARSDRGLVAVGVSTGDDGDTDGRVWLSVDGTDWSAVTDADLGGPGDQFINGIATGGPGFIAVGQSDRDGDLDIAAWTSSDGLDWETVTSPALGGPGDQVTWPFGRPVLVTDGMILVSGMDEDDAAIWTSVDGLSWTRAEVSEVLGGAREQMMAGLVPGPPGVLAGGWDHPDAAVWTSPDGADWTRVDSFGGPGEQRITAVIATEDGYVAVGDSVTYEEIYYLGRGSKGKSDAVVWTSNDGSFWEAVDGLEELGDQHMYNVGALGSTVVAVGINSPDPRTGGLFEAGPSSGRDVDGAVWISDDGRSWTRIRSDALGGENWQDIFDLVEFDGALLAVGGDDAEGWSETN